MAGTRPAMTRVEALDELGLVFRRKFRRVGAAAGAECKRRRRDDWEQSFHRSLLMLAVEFPQGDCPQLRRRMMAFNHADARHCKSAGNTRRLALLCEYEFTVRGASMSVVKRLCRIPSHAAIPVAVIAILSATAPAAKAQTPPPTGFSWQELGARTFE